MGNAYTFQFYGLPSLTTMSWGGNNTYVGTIYAPEANFTLGGGGADPREGQASDYQGALVAKSAVLNGHFNIHYDENLKKISLPTGFDVASWQELPPPTSVASSTPPATSSPMPESPTSAVQ